MKLITSADALSRATYNALLYCPKDAPWDMCLVILTTEGVSIVTSDGYSLAWAVCPATLPDDLADLITDECAMKLSRDSLKGLEERSRKDGKKEVHLTFIPGESLSYHGEDPEMDMSWLDIFVDSEPGEERTLDEYFLEEFRAIIDERLRDPRTQRVVLAPKYLRKLGQLKKTDKDQGADFLFAGEDEEVLIKVGPEFRLAIQRIDAERHSEALGEGATWSLSTPSTPTV